MYKATLFHPDGDSVTDFNRKTKAEVWESVADMGSRWFFYPIPFVTTDKTIVDTPEGLEFLKGKRIKTVKAFFELTWEYRSESICEDLNAGLPLNFVYDSM